MDQCFFRNLQITAEAVGSGHPDKICDQIADRILEAYLKNDLSARVACEVFASDKTIMVGGEITAHCGIDINNQVQRVLTENGYDFSAFEVISRLREQSPELSAIINKRHHLNVGDQCITVGFACHETKQLMPIGFVLAQELVKRIGELTKVDAQIKHDMKSQVTMDYDQQGNFSIDSMLVSVQHSPSLSLGSLHEKIVKMVMIPLAEKYQLNTDFKKYVNPAGKFVLGGLVSDTGLTGRKLIVDTYGPYARNGGGALSGKDPTKIDRTGTYYARWIAKHVVASGLADFCEVQLGWRIGNNTPISILVDCFGTNKIALCEILWGIKQNFPLAFQDVIDQFDLFRCRFAQLAIYGHFGRDENKFLWEKLNPQIVAKLKSMRKSTCPEN